MLVKLKSYLHAFLSNAISSTLLVSHFVFESCDELLCLLVIDMFDRVDVAKCFHFFLTLGLSFVLGALGLFRHPEVRWHIILKVLLVEDRFLVQSHTCEGVEVLVLVFGCDLAFFALDLIVDDHFSTHLLSLFSLELLDLVVNESL